MVSIIDELSGIKGIEVSKVEAIILDEFEKQEREGKKAVIIYDTFIQKLSETHHYSLREAMNLTNEVAKQSELIRSDQTTIEPKYHVPGAADYRILQCQTCGARYSNKLPKCPGYH
jgi:hypothetical protein